MIAKFTGDHYHGYDEGNGGKKVGPLKNGDVVEMSKQMGDRLEKQFPDQWEPATEKDLAAFSKKAPAPAPANMPPAANAEPEEKGPKTTEPAAEEPKGKGKSKAKGAKE